MLKRRENALFSLASEMRRLPQIPAARIESRGELAVSLIIPARNSADSLERAVSQAHEFLTRGHPGDFEIILVPNPGTASALRDPSVEIAEKIAARFERVRVCPDYAARGKGAALRTGFLSSRGRAILFTDADLPYDLGFFNRALEEIRGGCHFVTGNRRLPTSHFQVPVRLLNLAYRRHRLGLLFNRVVRLLLPIRTTDTQAGIKAMSRKFAIEAFSSQACPGFFFDLEFFLTAASRGFRHSELPVTLYLNSEKSTVRVLRESVLAGFWLARISLRHFGRAYGSPIPASKIVHRYRGPSLSLSTRAFLAARWKMTPYQDMTQWLPAQGKILDLGCGHGLFALAAALSSEEREILGLDHDPTRISLAQRAGRGISNLRFSSGTIDSIDSIARGEFSGIALIDVMHYFDLETQARVVRDSFEKLAHGGKLLIREVNPDGGFIAKWNRLYEKIATASGFTRAQAQGLHFRKRSEWTEFLTKQGFRVQSLPCSHPLFADVLFVCERP